MDEFNVEQERKKENKKNLFIIGSVILILLVIVIICCFIFKSATSNSKKVFVTVIDSIYNTALENINESYKDKIGGTFKIQTNLNSKNQDINNILKIINDLSLSYKFGIDYNSKKSHVEFETNYKNKSLITLSVDTEDNNSYVYLKDIYSKYINVPLEGYDKIFEVNSNHYKIVLKKLKDAFIKSLKEEYFETKDTTIKVENDSINVTEHKLILNEKNLTNLVKNLYKELNDEIFINSLAEILNADIEDIEIMLEEMKNESITLDEGTIYISIYTKQSEFIAFEIKDNAKTIKVISNNETSYNYEIKTFDNILNGVIECKNNNDAIDLIISFNSEDFNGSIIISISEQNEINIPDIDINNTIYYADLSENDQNKILDSLKSNKVLQELIEGIASILAPQLYM